MKSPLLFIEKDYEIKMKQSKTREKIRNLLIMTKLLGLIRAFEYLLQKNCNIILN
jgi:hypothetical protein